MVGAQAAARAAPGAVRPASAIPPRPGTCPPGIGNCRGCGEPPRPRLESLLREQAVELQGAEQAFLSYRAQPPAPPRTPQPPAPEHQPLQRRPLGYSAARRQYGLTLGSAEDSPKVEDREQELGRASTIDSVVTRVSCAIGTQLDQMQHALQWQMAQMQTAVGASMGVEGALPQTCSPAAAVTAAEEPQPSCAGRTAASRRPRCKATASVGVQCDLLGGSISGSLSDRRTSDRASPPWSGMRPPHRGSYSADALPGRRMPSEVRILAPTDLPPSGSFPRIEPALSSFEPPASMATTGCISPSIASDATLPSFQAHGPASKAAAQGAGTLTWSVLDADKLGERHMIKSCRGPTRQPRTPSPTSMGQREGAQLLCMSSSYLRNSDQLSTTGCQLSATGGMSLSRSRPRSPMPLEAKGSQILDGLVEALDSLSALPDDMAAISEHLCTLARELIGAKEVNLYTFVQKGDSQQLHDAIADTYHSMGSLTGSVVQRGALRIADRRAVTADAHYNALVDVSAGGAPEQFLALPIFGNHGESVGVLRALNKVGGDSFSTTDEWALGVLLHVWAARFSSYRQVTHMSSAADALVVMLNSVLDLVGAASKAELLQKICTNTADILGVERCMLHVADPDSGQLLAQLGNGEICRTPEGAGVVGSVASTGQGVHLAAPYQDPRFNKELDQRSNFRTRQLLCMPIRDGSDQDSRIIAVAEIANKVWGDFTDEDRNTFEVFARFAGVALDGRRLLDATRAAQEKGESMLQVARRLGTVSLDPDALRDNIIDEARRLVNADRGSLFVADWEAQQLTAAFGGRTVSMPIDAGIAGAVAVTGESQNIEDAYCDARFNKQVDLSTGYRTQSLLCVPVKFEGQVVAVAQLINKMNAAGKVCSFGNADMEVLDSFGAFAGIAIRISQHYKHATKEKAKFQAMLGAVAGMTQVDLRQDLDEWCENVVFRAKRLMGADRCTFFVVDKERRELFSRFADAIGKREIRIKMNQGIAGEVAVSGKRCNITDAYSDKRFNTDIDKQLGYVTKSILCVPVREGRETLAVIQLINKENDQAFDEQDEEMLEYFSILVGKMMKSVQLFRAIAENRTEMEKLMVFSSGGGGRGSSGTFLAAQDDSPKVHALLAQEPSGEELQAVATRDFDVLTYHRNGEEGSDRLCLLAAAMFHALGLMKRFNIDRTILLRFIHRIRVRYRDVPYHNFAHAFDVTQTLFCTINREGVREQLTDMDVLVLMVCGLCHDVDHMGLNNSFHYKAETPLGILSNALGSTSPLEVHHCNVAFEVLQDSEANVFGGMSTAEQSQCLKMMLRLILGTDMASHKRLMDEFARFCDQPEEERDLRQNIELVLTMLLKAADVSNPTKPFEISRKWALAVTEEFYMQGDLERDTTGSVENPMMDRAKNTEMASGQVGFINFVCVPFYTLICRYWPQLNYLVEALCTNRATWQNILATQKGEDARRGGGRTDTP